MVNPMALNCRCWIRRLLIALGLCLGLYTLAFLFLAKALRTDTVAGSNGAMARAQPAPVFVYYSRSPVWQHRLSRLFLPAIWIGRRLLPLEVVDPKGIKIEGKPLALFLVRYWL
jgi:hypothetical protein